MGSLADQLVASVRNSGTAVVNGDLVALSGAGQAALADADTALNVLGPVQAAGSVANGARMNVVTGGKAAVRLVSGLVPAAGDIVYLSTTAGRGTTIAPAVLPFVIGVVLDPTRYSIDSTVEAVVLPGLTVSGGGAAASWDPALVRYFFLDNEAGDDGNVGYIDAPAGSSFTAGQTASIAIRTAEQLRNILPRIGAGRSAVVLFKPRGDGGNYQNKAGASDFLDITYTGYNGDGQITMRASDLTNSINDRTDLAGVTGEVGPNADGSWTTTGAMAGTYGTTVTAGAGAFSVINTVTGLKFEWKGNVTAAARTVGNVVCDRLSGTTVNAGLVQTIANGDEFFLRAPGVRFTRIVGMGGANGRDSGNAVTVRGMNLLGFRFTNATAGFTWTGVINMQFCRFDGNVTADWTQAKLGVAQSYIDEGGTSRSVQCGIDFRGTASLACEEIALQYSAFHSTIFTAVKGANSTIGGGCYFNSAWTIQNARSPFLGGVAGFNNPARCPAGVILDSATGFIASAVLIGTVDIAGATTGLSVLGRFPMVYVGTLLGIATATALDLNGAVGAKVSVATTTTATGTTQDILLSGAAMTFAGLTLTNVIDQSGNDIEGSAGHVVDTCKLVANASGVALAIGDVVRGNGTPNQVTSAQADTAANAAVSGVMVTPPADTAPGYMATSGSPIVNFEIAPVPGAIAYLSTGTARRLTDVIPAVAGTNQKLRVGRVINSPNTTFTRVAWHPENISVLANGAA